MTCIHAELPDQDIKLAAEQGKSRPAVLSMIVTAYRRRIGDVK
jgi:hypothetical protein